MPTTKTKSKKRRGPLKAIAGPQRTPGAYSAPSSGHRIVLLGLEHIKAGKSRGRLCICTSDQNGETFFIGPKKTDTVLCPLCDERHPVVDFRTAVSNDDLDLKYGVYGICPTVLIESLLGIKGPGIVAKRGAMMRDMLRSADSAAVAGLKVIRGKFGSAPKGSAS